MSWYFAGGVTLNATDATRGFEVDSDPAGWTEGDTGSLLNRYDNAQAHSGARSMSVAGTATTVAWQSYNMGAVRSALSACFWFYTPSSTGGDDAPVILSIAVTAPSSSPSCRVYFRKLSGNYRFRIRGATDTSGSVNMSTGAWHRLEVQYVQNGTSTLKVYDSGGTLLETLTCTAGNNSCDEFTIGRAEAAATTTWTTAYFDDVGIAWTGTPAYPLWPYTVSN